MRGYTGPLFIGRDTHALSAAAEKVARLDAMERALDDRAKSVREAAAAMSGAISRSSARRGTLARSRA